jgi:FkbM family methyltransferase
MPAPRAAVAAPLRVVGAAGGGAQPAVPAAFLAGILATVLVSSTGVSPLAAWWRGSNDVSGAALTAEHGAVSAAAGAGAGAGAGAAAPAFFAPGPSAHSIRAGGRRPAPAQACPPCEACELCEACPVRPCPEPPPCEACPECPAPATAAATAAGGAGGGAAAGGDDDDRDCTLAWRTPLPAAASLAPMEVHIPWWVYDPTPGIVLPHGADGYTTASKAQGREDVDAVDRFFWGKTGGVIVESGAWNGVGFSTSHGLWQAAGWRSVHIEPAPASYAALVRNRPDALNIHAALCDTVQTVHWIEHVGVPEMERVHLGAIDGIAEFMSEGFRAQFWPSVDFSRLDDRPKIACRPLAPLLLQFGITHVDLWVLDVEGGELRVLSAMDLGAITVDVIVVEADGTAPDKDAGVIDTLKARGYDHVSHHARNDWFVRRGFRPSAKPRGDVAL